MNNPHAEASSPPFTIKRRAALLKVRLSSQMSVMIARPPPTDHTSTHGV